MRLIKSRRMRQEEYVECMGEIRDSDIFIGKLEGKRSHERPMCRWKDNIRMGLQKIGWEVVEWVHLAQNRDQWQALTDTCGFHKRQGNS
jgi:hypothetical protein